MTLGKSKRPRITVNEPAAPPPPMTGHSINFNVRENVGNSSFKEGIVVRPGDTLVISAFVYGDDDKLREIAELLYELIPDGGKVIVLDAANTQHIGVIRKQED